MKFEVFVGSNPVPFLPFETVINIHFLIFRVLKSVVNGCELRKLLVSYLIQALIIILVLQQILS